MNLTVATPFSIILSGSTDKINIPTTYGEWCLLPRHADCMLTLVAGVMTYEDGAQTCAVALNGGACIKTGSEVAIATNRAVTSHQLADLSHAVTEQFRREAEEERRTQTAMAKVEIGLIRRLLELEHAHD
jgi:alternate F1F0 ATPase F1 subunit epsilon